MLSVVIPTHESEQDLVRTLAVLVPGATAGLVREVIIADAGSTDGTLEVADAAGCRVLTSEARLGPRLKQAAAMAREAWLLFLQPGTVLDVTWIDEAASFIAHDVGAATTKDRAAVFRPVAGVQTQQPLVVEALSLLFAALGRRPRPQQGLLIAKPLYEAMGGHGNHADPQTDLLRRLGRRIVMLRSGASLIAKNRIASGE